MCWNVFTLTTHSIPFHIHRISFQKQLNCSFPSITVVITEVSISQIIPISQNCVSVGQDWAVLKPDLGLLWLLYYDSAHAKFKKTSNVQI